MSDGNLAAAAFGLAAAAGVAGSVGLIALYRALPVGKMGINSPITGVLAAAFPVLVAALTLGVPPAVRLTGFALAVAGTGIWCLSRPAGAMQRPRGLGLAALSGLGFGGLYRRGAWMSPRCSGHSTPHSPSCWRGFSSTNASPVRRPPD